MISDGSTRLLSRNLSVVRSVASYPVNEPELLRDASGNVANQSLILPLENG